MLSERLRELRKSRHMSQARLAKELNIAQNTLSNWETGKRAPDWDTLQQIAHYFKVPVTYLIGEDTPDIVDEFSHSNDILNYIDLYGDAVSSLQVAKTKVFRLLAVRLELCSRQEATALNITQLAALLDQAEKEISSEHDSVTLYTNFYQSFTKKIQELILELSEIFP